MLKRAMLVATAVLAVAAPTAVAHDDDDVRFATFNASLNRTFEGELVQDLSTPNDPQFRNVAEIIQRVRPDVLLINELDFVAGGEALRLFQRNYLSVSQNGARPIRFEDRLVVPSNTGIPTGKDLNNNGQVVTTPGAPGYGDDAYGFGAYPGQFGLGVLSRHEIDDRRVRTFQLFKWKDMPGNLIPQPFYSPDEVDILRLSSKTHADVPIKVGRGKTVHFLVSHPTPPVFDGPEDRNGRRNFDEIRFWADYISGARYIYDDRGRRGGLSRGERFVVAGDQNSDPLDGDSIPGAIQQLLDHPLVNSHDAPTSPGGPQQTALQGGANATHRSDPAFDTADFADGAPGNLRADYVLPDRRTDIDRSFVFWPLNTDPLFRLVGLFTPGVPDGNGFPASDHRLVAVDVELKGDRGRGHGRDRDDDDRHDRHDRDRDDDDR
jgi:Endonuclease/Exonuclease/phosphatase family